MKDNCTPAETVLHVGNLSPDDAQFLRDVIAVFTDPAFAHELGLLRRGGVCMTMSPAGNLRLSSTGTVPLERQNN